MDKVIVTGGTGFIGKEVIKELLRKDHQVLVMTRRPEQARKLFGSAVGQIPWDFTSPLSGLPPCKAVIHLAGEPLIGKRWNPVQKEIIRSSRVDSTKTLVAAMKSAKPTVFICSSAIGFYGDRGDEILDEKSTPSPKPDFLSEVCRQWEAQAAEAEKLGVRVVSLRTGVVLGKGGGALSKMLLPFKMGMGGPVGSGKQWMSWVHIDDVVGLIMHAIQKDAVRGAMNMTAPNPVTNKEFAQTLGEVLHRPAAIPTPTVALKLALGEVASVLTGSQRVLPKVAQSSGYAFRYSTLKEALVSLN